MIYEVLIKKQEYINLYTKTKIENNLWSPDKIQEYINHSFHLKLLRVSFWIEHALFNGDWRVTLITLTVPQNVS